MAILNNDTKFSFVTTPEICNNTASVISGLSYVMNLPTGISIYEVLTKDGTDITSSVVGNEVQALSIQPGECLELHITLNVDDNSTITCPIIATGQYETTEICDIPEDTLQSETYDCTSCFEIAECATIIETITTLVDNEDGTYTYTSEDATETIITEHLTSLAINGDGESLDYTDELGAVTNLDLCPIVESCETVTSISFSNPTLTYTDEAGVDTNLNLSALNSETTTTLVDNGNGTYTYTNEVAAAVIFTKVGIPLSEEFAVNVGNSFNISNTPNTNLHIQVFRNGLRVEAAGYSRVGTTFTFVTPFDSGGENIIIDYYRL